ncbi:MULTISPECIES: L-fucose isomerase [unclassified Paenibacillus]|uniref:L-fucose isomerase n=1 Tax=unclassified Paenibacillus TaxID=185978 RepID=UPI00240665C0|nr:MULTISPECIES: L-fucose isomerase [unclassified Paenibacillus]MDF9844536.1 L-fucose isomerase [Paenibacillus sp. PastF-2]MDF9851179.1 L-fucose isomerase [Paenibacillus sp. PastM-2]MDF9856186.1 L-fucose isomerase [Paenibacillus sp. PastF-1]MDH6481585.1 L-fucose isomerase [Paenibacillus sp. PastH-2]MDH6510403.1 L-fucose isomerase [Paenibacillus sp. PastM-3]
MATNYPKIGIRPTIDGRRRGVRESLEAQTMGMAERVAKFLTESLFYPDGSPVECVIADSTIGGVKEAAAAAQKFAGQNVGVSITVTPCWCYGSETMDMDATIPHAVWGFNGTERPGAVYLAAVLSAYAQKGIPAFGIYGEDVQESSSEEIPADVQTKLLQFAKSAMAVALMKGKSYLSMGSVSMGIAGSIVNEQFFQDYLGMRNEYTDMSEYVRRFEEEIYDKEEFAQALAWVKEKCRTGADNNPQHLQISDELKEQQWETCVKMTLIARDLMVGNPRLAELGFEEEANGHNAIVGGFQGQRQWTDHFPNGDFIETILNSSFDWNGRRAPYIVATENDSLNGVTMLFNYLLTNTAQIFADVRTFWSPAAVKRVTGYELEGEAAHGLLHLINSGSAALDGTGEQSVDGKPAIKPFWEITDDEAERCIAETQFRPASQEYFRGGGFSTDYLTKGGMPVTMARLNLVKGLGPVLQLVEGYTIELPEEVHKTLDERTDPTWPTTWFAPKLTNQGSFKTVYDVMNNWGANHGAISYGHIGADLITLASILRIPVSMHNVEESRIFRPRVWSLFGTEDLESADYRACRNFGPLY